MDKDLFAALSALCSMWNQYCGTSWGHMGMSAGEHAQHVLDKYQLLKNDAGFGGQVDFARLEELRKSVFND